MNIKKYTRTVILATAIIIIISITSYTGFGKIGKKTNKLESNSTSIERWYLVAESQDYKIFTSGLRGGYISVVLDKNKKELLVPSESCEVKIPSEKKNIPDGDYYNETVGIINLGPYKSIHYKEGSENTFNQSVFSTGCVFEEGEVTLFPSQIPGKVDCSVNIKYKHIGC